MPGGEIINWQQTQNPSKILTFWPTSLKGGQQLSRMIKQWKEISDSNAKELDAKTMPKKAILSMKKKILELSYKQPVPGL